MDITYRNFKTMNILYILPNINVTGGISRIVISKANYLADTPGFNVTICYYGSSEDKSVYYINEKIHKIPISINKKKSIWYRFINVIHSTNIVKNIIKKHDINIAINANAPYLLWTLPLICKKCKKIHEFHFSYDGQEILDNQIFHNILLRNAIHHIRRACVNKFDKSIVLTHSDKEKWKLNNTIVIPNFTDIVCCSSYPIESKNVIAVGRLELQKDYPTMIKAWSIVHKKHPDWQLRIFGEGSQKNKLTQLTEELNLNNTIHILGNTNKIIQEYQQSSFLILSSIYEGLPLVIIEAQRCGLPCITFDITGAKEIIKDKKTGLIVQEHNIKALAEAINLLIEDSNLRNKLHENAIYESAKFSKENIMDQWIKLFIDLKNNTLN